MNNQSQKSNDRLLNDAMSTPELESFYNSVEKQVVEQMTVNASIPKMNAKRRMWMGLGGFILVLATAITFYVLSTNNAEVRVTESAPISIPQEQTVEPSSQPTSELRSNNESIPSNQKQTIEPSGGAATEGKVTAHTEPAKPLTEQTQNIIDSLDKALQSASVPFNQARIGYQLGVRHRTAGNNAKALSILLKSSNTAKTIGANLLAARGAQQAARAAADLGNLEQAIQLYNNALSLLPTTEPTLRNKWQMELDSLKH